MSQRTTDPNVDPCNSQFNPEKALMVKHNPMTKHPKIFDNLQMLQAASQRINNEIETKLLVEGLYVRSENPVENSRELTRRFLPHQGLVEKKSVAKFSKNILKRWESGYDGPLGTLKQFMDDQVKVKIYVRKEHGVRGTITGFIEAFDKHWNIALKSVEENWIRRKICVSENNIISHNTLLEEVALEKIKQMGITVPKLKLIKSINRKYVELSRNVPQLLIRGEQIVLVSRFVDK